MHKWISISIIVAAIIGSLGFYKVQAMKQESIERQQQITIEENKRIAEEKAETLKLENEARAEQTQKEYVAKRKSDCLDIYKTEGAKWNNATGWRYAEDSDLCYIEYKEEKPKTKTECEDLYPSELNGVKILFNFFKRSLCEDGRFENSF